MIQLTQSERAMADELEAMLDEFWPLAKKDEWSVHLRPRIILIGEMAQKLHDSLRQRNIEPKHGIHLCKNRWEAKEPFYEHVHAAQSLLAFIDGNFDPMASSGPRKEK